MGTDERFAGYGVMGLPFSSGHLMALRCFSVSSVGAPYSSVWIRDPGGAWTIATTVSPELSCPRYFAGVADRRVTTEINVEWTSTRSLRVRVADPALDWRVDITSTPLTSAMSAACAALPDGIWRRSWFSRPMGSLAAALLRTGALGLSGWTPNRQRFVARPRRVWLVQDSTAVLEGTVLGAPAPLPVQTALGDFWLPQRGLFMVGWSAFDPRADTTGPLAP